MIVGDQDRRHGPVPNALRALSLGLAALVVLVTALAPASAQTAARGPLVLTGPASVEAVSRHFDYITDPAWQLEAADFVDPAALELKPVTGPVPDFGYTAAKVWLRLELVNATAATAEWRLVTQLAFTQEIAVYRIGEAGEVANLLDLEEASPFSARPIDYPQIVVPFSLAPGEAATLVVSYYSMGASRHGFAISTPEGFADRARVDIAKNYAFYGMMLLMMALAAVALVVLRQPVFAAYLGYISSIFLYIAQADGTAFQVLWPGLPQLNTMAASVAGSGVMVFGGLFAMTFLRTARFHPVMHRVLLAVVVAVLALDIVLWAVDPKLLNRLLVYMILVCVVAYLAAGLVAARTRFREVRFYVLAWAASLIPAILFTARFAFGLETSLLTPYDAIRLALVVDALMMGLAIFDSYNHMRQAAMEETLAQTRRNLALSQRLAALEERYAEAATLARRREESVKDTVHDLRQPMHALRLSLRQMLSPGTAATADAGQVESALAYMERLVAERLAADARPAGADAPDPPPAGAGAGEPGLHGVLRGVADMFAPEAAAKGLGLRLVLAAPDASVAAYPLMRVVANLVSNAIKYSPEGRVVLALRRHGDGHRIEVHDTGPGLSGPAFEEALVRNRRLDRDRDVAEGSGLGLSVATETAATHGWRLTSCPDRRTGATIRLDLPPAAAVPPAAPPTASGELTALDA